MVDREPDILGENPIGTTPDGRPIFPAEDPIEAIHGVVGAQSLNRPRLRRVYPKKVSKIPPEHEKTNKAPGEVQFPLVDEKISPFSVDQQDPRIVRFNPNRINRGEQGS